MEGQDSMRNLFLAFVIDLRRISCTALMETEIALKKIWFCEMGLLYWSAYGCMIYNMVLLFNDFAVLDKNTRSFFQVCTK